MCTPRRACQCLTHAKPKSLTKFSVRKNIQERACSNVPPVRSADGKGNLPSPCAALAVLATFFNMWTKCGNDLEEARGPPTKQGDRDDRSCFLRQVHSHQQRRCKHNEKAPQSAAAIDASAFLGRGQLPPTSLPLADARFRCTPLGFKHNGRATSAGVGVEGGAGFKATGAQSMEAFVSTSQAWVAGTARHNRQATVPRSKNACVERQGWRRTRRSVACAANRVSGVDQLRDGLLELGRRTARGVDVSRTDTQMLDEMVRNLLELQSRSIGQGEDDVGAAPDEAFVGRWDLKMSTETELVRLMRGSWPLAPAQAVYQDVESVPTIEAPRAKLTNVVGYGANRSLRVSAQYSAERTPGSVHGWRCPFVFESTTIALGAGRSLSLPFAIGRGYFDVLYMDAQMRVDRDKNGWINVYTYAGPIVPCSRAVSR
ncbi:hypothetical protein FVE85_6048 [Porphyridium purpureum]|uniref:Plastid lipid-associated protein/fibrillin conserved domain-containing protein n=1 Tax=Porphyridium purpureum TaxID=35688 RepID=A0A5J4Z6K9_PORPP|nr:hypothetical protein FVE85_6048 [Porphyridium purpureum]|eukprot:POR8284..scf295_1